MRLLLRKLLFILIILCLVLNEVEYLGVERPVCRDRARFVVSSCLGLSDIRRMYGTEAGHFRNMTGPAGPRLL